MKIKMVFLVLLAFVTGVLFSYSLIPNKTVQRLNSYNALSLDVELNAAIVNLKDFDEGRTDMLKETLERNLQDNLQEAKSLLSEQTVLPEQKVILGKKIAIAELALKDRTKTLDELLFKK